MVECLNLDWGAAGSSLNGITALCPWARHINPSLILVQPRKNRPYITERLGLKESNQPYFTEGHTNLPREAIGLKGSICFLRGVRTSISKETYNCLWFSRGWGVQSLSLLWIRPCVCTLYQDKSILRGWISSWNLKCCLVQILFYTWCFILFRWIVSTLDGDSYQFWPRLCSRWSVLDITGLLGSDKSGRSARRDGKTDDGFICYADGNWSSLHTENTGILH